MGISNFSKLILILTKREEEEEGGEGEEQDVCKNELAWIGVAKHLTAKEIVELGMTEKWFQELMSEDAIWRYAFARDMDLPHVLEVLNNLKLKAVTPSYLKASFPWKEIYVSGFDHSCTYEHFEAPDRVSYRGSRIGGFLLDSPIVLLTDTVPLPDELPALDTEARSSIEHTGMCWLKNIKTGMWIADLCTHKADGSAAILSGRDVALDARHAELFLEEGCKKKIWQYEEIGNHGIPLSKGDSSVAGIFGQNHLSSYRTSYRDIEKEVIKGSHSVVVRMKYKMGLSGNFLDVKYEVVKNSSGQIMAIRISILERV